MFRSDEGLTLETSALYSLRWPIYIFNLVDITKLSFNKELYRMKFLLCILYDGIITGLELIIY